MSKRKNLIILGNVVKYNSLNFKESDTEITLPTYVVDYVIENKLKLVITSNDKILKEYDYQDLLLSMVLVIDGDIKGSFLGKDITYKLMIIKL